MNGSTPDLPVHHQLPEFTLSHVLSEKEIESYIATGEPMDKAGAYGIQGGAALFAQRMVGDYYNVMGLPVCRLYEILTQLAPDYMEENQ